MKYRPCNLTTIFLVVTTPYNVALITCYMDITLINQQPCGKVLYEAMQNSIIKRVKRIFIVQALGVVINVLSLFKWNKLRPVAIARNERTKE